MSGPTDGRVVPVTDTRGSVQRALEDAREALSRLTNPSSRANKQVEVVGEAAARRWVERTYAGEHIVTEVKVPRRGSLGPPVLDVVYELEHRATQQRRFLVIEAKGGTSRLGTLFETAFAADEAGTLRPLAKEVSYRQFSAPWFEQRLSELDKMKGHRGLGTRLRAAAEEGRIEAKIIRAGRLPTTHPGTVRVDVEHFHVEDDVGTAWTEHFRSQARGVIERGTARQSSAVGSRSAAAVEASSAPAEAVHPSPPGPRPLPERGVPSRAAPSRALTTAERDALKLRLESGRLRVEGVTGDDVRIAVKRGSTLRRTVVGVGTAVLPAVADMAIQRGLDRQVQAVVEQGLAWLARRFPMPQTLERTMLDRSRRSYATAKRNLDRHGPLWMELFERPEARGSEDWRETHDAIRGALLPVGRHIDALAELADLCSGAATDLTPVVERVAAYARVLYDFAQDLEDKVKWLLYFPQYGSALTTSLFGWSQYVEGVARRVGQLESAARELLSGYLATHERVLVELTEASELEDDWLPLFTAAGGDLARPLAPI